MSRVLARSMFKKKAPKRSSKGVGITAMLEDDVPGYAEGGEVIDDRTERERLARQLLEQNRDQGEMYQRFSEQERPRMYRPPATMPMPPQPNPQQMQAMQMQQMAQMGMIPRFQEGGFVQRQPLSGWGSRIRGWSEPSNPEVPSAWSQVKNDVGSMFGIPALMDQRTRDIQAQNDPNAMTPAMEPTVSPWLMWRGKPIVGWRDSEMPEPPSGGRISGFTWGGTKEMKDLPPEAAPVAPRPEERPDIAEMDREAARGRAFRNIEQPPASASKRGDRLPGGKNTDIDGIKEERAARAQQRAMEAEAARKENMWLALMQAGLAIAGGRSPNAITNIGQGGQAGLASFMALEQQRRRDEDAAMRRDIAEREYNLQERRFKAMEPVYAAQAMAPAIRAQIAAARTQAEINKLIGNDRLQAIRDVREEVQKNPMNYTGKDGKPDELKIQTRIAERQREYEQARGGVRPPSSGGMGGLGLDLPDEYDLGD